LFTSNNVKELNGDRFRTDKMFYDYDGSLITLKLSKFFFDFFCLVKLYFSTFFADTPRVSFILKSESAKIPKRGNKYSAAYDLYSDVSITLKPFTHAKIETNVSVNMNNSQTVYGRIAGRSGLALKNGILIGGGVIDSDYAGTLGIIAFNMSNNEVSFEVGDRVAQLIFERKAYVLFDEEYVTLEKRGASGFGSTGKQD